jgi:hypothetical protein
MKCDSNVKDFYGCTGEAREGTVSCEPCFSEYCRRSSALDRKRAEEKEALISILDPMAEASWEDKPKVRVLFSNFFSHSAEGKVRKGNGCFLLMKQKNSSRGFVITYEITLGDAVQVEVLDRKGERLIVWKSETNVASVSEKAKEIADSYEKEAVNA